MNCVEEVLKLIKASTEEEKHNRLKMFGLEKGCFENQKCLEMLAFVSKMIYGENKEVIKI